MFNSSMDLFFNIVQGFISWLMSFNVFGFPLAYIIIISFILGIVIDTVILKG